MQATQELPIRAMSPLLPPRALKSALPMTEAAHHTVLAGRAAVQRILRREDRRLLVVVGPCSIHDPEAALEYTGRLNALRQELADRLCIVMRVTLKNRAPPSAGRGSSTIHTSTAPTTSTPDCAWRASSCLTSTPWDCQPGPSCSIHHPALPR